MFYKSKHMLVIGILILFLISCANYNTNNNDPNIAISSKDLIEGVSTDLTNLHKENYLKVIIDNPKYCYGKNSNPDCICQENYSKLFDGDYDYCIPNLCLKVFGLTLVGDVYKPNYEYCEWAVRDANAEICDRISTQEGKDICMLASVGRTNNLEECEKIESEVLKNECYN